MLESSFQIVVSFTLTPSWLIDMPSLVRSFKTYTELLYTSVNRYAKAIDLTTQFWLIVFYCVMHYHRELIQPSKSRIVMYWVATPRNFLSNAFPLIFSYILPLGSLMR